MVRVVTTGLMGIITFLSQQAVADQFHYNNIIIGDRAMGLGGAWTAVADDASGVYYNPAGLGFALSNDVSGSANAYYSREVTYKKTIGNADFKETSAGSVPSFFGGMQKLDNIAKGLVFAFGMYNTDSELKDQDDIIENATLNSSSKINRYHRTVNQRGSTFTTGAAVGYRVADSFSLGFGLNYITVGELVQEYQNVNLTQVTVVKGQQVTTDYTLAQNIRQNLTSYGIQPTFGIQAALGGGVVSLGLTAKMGKWVSDNLDLGIDKNEVILTSSQYSLPKSNTNDKTKKPLGSMASEYRLGTAIFASTRLLITFDIAHYTAVTDGAKIVQNNTETVPLFNKEAVTNLAGGLEYYIMPQLPIRVGAFTNNDARPEIDKTKSNQRDHIDYIGESLFLAWVQPNSQIAAGVILQQGKGQAQKIGGSTVQEVEGASRTIAFSATSSF